MACLLATGVSCSSSGPTTVLVHIELGDSVTAPTEITITAFDPHGTLIGAKKTRSAVLPGDLVLTGIGDIQQKLRLMAVGQSPSGSSIGVAMVETETHRQVKATLTLRNGLADADADGVPDTIDNCLNAVNPGQEDANGNGTGNVCDSAVTDAGISDGAMDGTVLTGCAGLLLCEGFESGMIDDQKWAADISGNITGGLSVQTSEAAHRGAYYLRAYNSSGNPRARALLTAQAPAASPIYIRFYGLFPAGSPQVTSQMSVWTQTASPFGGIGLNVTKDHTLGLASFQTAPTISLTSTATVPSDDWFCVEWKLDRTTGDIQVWLNDGEVAPLHATNFVPSPAVNELAVGLAPASGETPVATSYVHVDDIAVATTRIGCAR